MENTLETTKHYRYYTEGDIENCSHLIFILHGYGQLAKFFIRKFNHLVDKNTAIIAPEGMHRFYLKGSSGRVGASWMTKEAREDDIDDNLNFLNKLYELVGAKNKLNLSLIGFSQGGATAARWHQAKRTNFNNFVLWASVFPPDLAGLEEDSSFDNSKNYFLVGDKDEYFSTKNINSIKSDFETKNLSFTFIEFEGDHNIFPEPLDQLKSEL